MDGKSGPRRTTVALLFTKPFFPGQVLELLLPMDDDSS